MLQQTTLYNPTKSYEENFESGPTPLETNKQPYQNTGEPTFSFVGTPVYAPFGIPAGPLLNSKHVTYALQKGFDICTYKTVRTKKHPVHPKPNVLAIELDGNLTLERAKQPLTTKSDYNAPLSITNSFGVPSMDPDFWQPDMKKSVEAAGRGQVVIGSYQGTRNPEGNTEEFIADFVLGSRLVKETGAKVIEINLSCPNEGTGNLLCYDLERVKVIVDKVKNEIGNTPLLLKLGYFESDEQLEQFLLDVGNIVQGLVAINTIPAQIVDKNGKQALPGNGRLVSGVCGAGIKWAGLDMTKRLKALREKLGIDLEIIGIGGVMTPKDFQEYRDAGADAVQSATGAMWNTNLAAEIKATL